MASDENSKERRQEDIRWQSMITPFYLLHWLNWCFLLMRDKCLPLDTS